MELIATRRISWATSTKHRRAKTGVPKHQTDSRVRSLVLQPNGTASLARKLLLNRCPRIEAQATYGDQPLDSTSSTDPDSTHAASDTLEAKKESKKDKLQHRFSAFLQWLAGGDQGEKDIRPDESLATSRDANDAAISGSSSTTTSSDTTSEGSGVDLSNGSLASDVASDPSATADERPATVEAATTDARPATAEAATQTAPSAVADLPEDSDVTAVASLGLADRERNGAAIVAAAPNGTHVPSAATTGEVDADVSRQGSSSGSDVSSDSDGEGKGDVAGDDDDWGAVPRGVDDVSAVSNRASPVNSWEMSSDGGDEEEGWGGFARQRPSKKGYITAAAAVIGAALLTVLVFKSGLRRARLRQAVAPSAQASYVVQEPTAQEQQAHHAAGQHVGDVMRGEVEEEGVDAAAAHVNGEGESSVWYPDANTVESALDRQAAGEETPRDEKVLAEVDRQVDAAEQVVRELDPEGAGKMAAEADAAQVTAHGSESAVQQEQGAEAGAAQETGKDSRSADEEMPSPVSEAVSKASSTSAVEDVVSSDADGESTWRTLPLELWAPVEIPEMPPLPTFDTPQSVVEAATLPAGTSYSSLRQRASVASRSSAAAAEAAYRASSYSSAASSAASRAAEAARAAAEAAARAYHAAESKAEHELSAAEARLEAALAAAESAQQQAAEATAYATANEDVATSNRAVAEKAAEVVRPTSSSPSALMQLQHRVSDWMYTLQTTAATAGQRLLALATGLWLAIRGWSLGVWLFVVNTAHSVQTWFAEHVAKFVKK